MPSVAFFGVANPNTAAEHAVALSGGFGCCFTDLEQPTLKGSCVAQRTQRIAYYEYIAGKRLKLLAVTSPDAVVLRLGMIRTLQNRPTERC